jgi:hypothetical protein
MPSNEGAVTSNVQRQDIRLAIHTPAAGQFATETPPVPVPLKIDSTAIIDV